MNLAEGVRLGPYEILAPLGAGGMGEVYRARDTRLDRSGRRDEQYRERPPVTGVVPFGTEGDVQLLALDGSRRPTPVLDGAAAEADAFLSPDGRLVTYASLESGRLQNYVAELGPDGRAAARWQISVEDGRRPVWTPDGKAILYLDERANLIRVDVERIDGNVRFGEPEGLASTTGVQDYDSLAVGPDGRIWMVQFGEEQGEPLRLIENWTELLPR